MPVCKSTENGFGDPNASGPKAISIKDFYFPHVELGRSITISSKASVRI